MHLPVRTSWRLLLATIVAVPLAVGVIPLAGTPLTLNAFVQAKIVVLALALGLTLGAWALTRARETGLFAGRGLLPVAALALAATASTVFALDPRMAVFGDLEQGTGLIAVLMCLLVLFLTTQLVRDEAHVARITDAVIWTAAGIAVAGLLQQLVLIDVLGYFRQGAPEWMVRRGYGTIGNPDTYAAYLVLPALLALHRMRKTTEPRERVRAALAFALILTSLVLAFTRGPLVGLAVGVIAYVLGSVRPDFGARTQAPARKTARAAAQRRSRVPGPALGIIVGVVLVSLLLSFIVGAGADIAGRLVDPQAIASLGDRGPLWTSALEIVREHPVLGVGPDSFRLAWYPTRTIEQLAGGAALMITDPHNVVLYLAATMGLVGLAAGLWLVLSTLLAGWRNPARERVADYDGWLFGTLALAVTLLSSMTAIVLVFMLCLGLGVLLSPTLRPGRTRKHGAGLPITLASIAVSLALIVFAGLTLAAQLTAVGVYSADEAEAAVRAARAANIAPWDTRLRDLQNQTMAQAALGRVFASDPDAEAIVSAAQADLIADQLAEPREFLHFYRSTVLLIGAGQHLGDRYVETGIEVGLGGLELYPNSLELRTGLAAGFMQLETPARAEAVLKDVWDADPAYLPAGTTYAEALVALGRSAEAEDVLALLRERFPDSEALPDLDETPVTTD